MSEHGARAEVWVMVGMGWFIVIANFYVLGFIKHGIPSEVKLQADIHADVSETVAPGTHVLERDTIYGSASIHDTRRKKRLQY